MDLEKEAAYILPLLVFLTYSTLYLYPDVFNDISRDGDINEWMREVEHQTVLEFFNPLPQAGTTATSTYYRPIQKIIWKIQMDTWGEYSSNYRIYWILIHNITAAMVYLLCRKLSLERGTALLSSALFFTLRPNIGIVKHEIAMAGHGLAAIFFIMTLVFFIDYLRKGTLKAYAGSFVFFVLAVLTSESVITLFVILMALHLFLQPRDDLDLKKSFRVHSPFIVLSLLLMFFSALRYPIGFVANNWGGSYFGTYTVTRLLDYLTLLVYPFSQTEFMKLVLLNVVVVVACVSLLTFKGVDRFLVLWVIICLLPFSFSNFRPIESLWRYIYQSSIAFAILTSKSVVELFSKRKVTLLSIYSLVYWAVNIGFVTKLIEG